MKSFMDINISFPDIKKYIYGDRQLLLKTFTILSVDLCNLILEIDEEIYGYPDIKLWISITICG